MYFKLNLNVTLKFKKISENACFYLNIIFLIINTSFLNKNTPFKPKNNGAWTSNSNNYKIKNVDEMPMHIFAFNNFSPSSPCNDKTEK